MSYGQRTISLTPHEAQRRLEHIHPVHVDPDKSEAAADIAKRSAGIPIPAVAYDMRSFLQQVIEHLLQESSSTDFKNVMTRSIDSIRFFTETLNQCRAI